MSDVTSVILAIHIYRPRRRPYTIYCEACVFDFERSNVAAAREWAVKHNQKNHEGKLSIVDHTANPTRIERATST